MSNSQIMGTPNYRNLADVVQEPPYDGKQHVRPDRKTGWKVNHPMLGRWLEPIPLRGLADEIVKAFNEIAEKAYASGYSDSQEEVVVEAKQAEIKTKTLND